MPMRRGGAPRPPPAIAGQNRRGERHRRETGDPVAGRGGRPPTPRRLAQQPRVPALAACPVDQTSEPFDRRRSGGMGVGSSIRTTKYWDHLSIFLLDDAKQCLAGGLEDALEEGSIISHKCYFNFLRASFFFKKTNLWAPH